jgi:uncharacterized protein (DUF1501 family)
MAVSRRDFLRLSAGSGAAALLGQLGATAVRAADASSYRAMVGVFLFGGADNWNLLVPTDGRYAAYAAGRSAALALPQASLVPLADAPFGLHPAFAPLQPAWTDGALAAVTNVGTLFQPLTKAQYAASPNLRPVALLSHSDQQNEWQGLRMRDPNLDGFMGRVNDREAMLAAPSLISFGGSTLAVIGKSASPLVLPSNGAVVRNGFNAAATDPAVVARQAALAAFADASGLGTTASVSGTGIHAAYAQATAANGILTSTTSTVDQYFRNPTTGAALTSNVSRQLLRTARMIEARGTLGHGRQVFFVSQGGYDTHSNQVNAATTTGTQANLFADLAMALAGFYDAMKGLGLAENVTAFTMSDFGRTFRANAQRGTDHAWGNNHLVLGGALKNRQIHGAYPDLTLGGPQDIDTNGRWLPTTSVEEYLAPIAAWYGVASADLPYIFPNYATWTSGGRNLLPLFG